MKSAVNIMNGPTSSVLRFSDVTERRVLAAFLVAPLVVPIVFSASAFVPFHWRDYFTTLLVMAFYVLPAAYLFEILLGIPAWVIFRVCHLRSVVAFAVGGAVIGLLVDIIMKMPSKTVGEWNLDDILYVGAALGSALLFRVIAPSSTSQSP